MVDKVKRLEATLLCSSQKRNADRKSSLSCVSLSVFSHDINQFSINSKMSDKQQLLDMGFQSERVDWALHATSNKGLQPAMDHLVENSERPIPTDWKSSTAAATTSANNNQDVSTLNIHSTALGLLLLILHPLSSTQSHPLSSQLFPVRR